MAEGREPRQIGATNESPRRNALWRRRILPPQCPPPAPLKHGGFSRSENFSIIVAASSEDEQRPKIDLALSNTCDGRGAGFCQPRMVAKGSRLVRGDELVQSLLGNPALAFRAAHATVSAARS